MGTVGAGLPGGLGRGLSSGLTPLSPWLLSMKGQSARLRNATGAELWQRFQRPLQDLQLWTALAQSLLDITASLPDLPSIHTFLPQVEVTVSLPGGLTGAGGRGGGQQPGVTPEPFFQGKACPWSLQVSG